MDKRLLKGTASELIAATYFTEEGCEVYFGCFGNTSCDFIVITPDGTLQRVEVRSASATPPVSAVRWSIGPVRRENFDVLAVVLPSGTVLVNPDRTTVYGA